MTAPSNVLTNRDPFEPRAYNLNAAKAIALPLVTVTTTEAASPEKQTTTLDAVYDRLGRHKLLYVEEFPHHTDITTDEGITVLEGPPFARAVLVALLKLRKVGVDGFSAWWFWYDDDYVDDDPDHQSFTFFVVYDNQIVPEAFSFNRYSGSGFDLSVFELHKPYEHWYNAPDSFDAFVRCWYRKFYLETLPGQQMVLRGGAPLFYCADARVDQKALQQALLAEVQRLRWRMQWLIVLLLVVAVILWAK